MDLTTTSDKIAPPERLRTRKRLGAGVLLIAWACSAVATPILEDYGTVALLQYMAYQQASSAAALAELHLRVIDTEKILLQHLVPAEAVDLATWDHLGQEYHHLREQRRRDWAVAAQHVALARGNEVAPGREDALGSEERRQQQALETQTIVAGMTEDFRRYHLLGRVAEAAGQLALILGILFLL